MLIVNLVLGLGITIAVLYAVFRTQRKLRGGDRAGLVSAGIRRSRGERAGELEQFIADYRAQQGPALARQLIDSTPDHRLGLDLRQPASVPALEAPARLVYLLLRTQLPDHHVFPNARAGDFTRDATPTQAVLKVGFLVCDRDFRPVCAISLVSGAAPVLAETAALDGLLRDIGLRHLRWEHAKLPPRNAVRAQVLVGLEA